MGFGLRKGCTSMAFTGQAISQLKQVQQSCGYLILAFLVSSMTITSPGHISAQIPHPTQDRSSILRIIYHTSSLKTFKPWCAVSNRQHIAVGFQGSERQGGSPQRPFRNGKPLAISVHDHLQAQKLWWFVFSSGADSLCTQQMWLWL